MTPEGVCVGWGVVDSTAEAKCNRENLRQGTGKRLRLKPEARALRDCLKLDPERGWPLARIVFSMISFQLHGAYRFHI